MATTTLVNYLGVIPSGRTQLIAMLAIVGFLMSAIAAGSLRFHPSNLTPITPRDLPSLGGAGAIIFWSFLGWENAVHAAEELRDPTKDLRRAAALSVLLIGSLYFSLGLITVGARAYYDDPQQDALAFALLLGDVMGGGAFVAAGVLAFLVTLATLNAYTLGVSRLVFGMAREGSMPSALAALHPRHRVPHRTLLLLLGLGSGALLVIGLLDLDYTTLFLLVGASFIILYLMAAGAAVRTLRGRALRAYALVTLVAFLIFLTLLGLRSPSSLLYPAAAALIALAVLGLSRRRRQPSRGEGGIL
jgi:amino acid transporter